MKGHLAKVCHAKARDKACDKDTPSTHGLPSHKKAEEELQEDTLECGMHALQDEHSPPFNVDIQLYEIAVYTLTASEIRSS